MRIAVTGGHGFLGWHLACRAFATQSVVPTRLGRQECADPRRFAASLLEQDTVIHLAAVNRAPSDDAVFDGNVDAAAALAQAIEVNKRPVRVVYANSIQADADNAYGRGKARAAEIIQGAVAAVGGTMSDVLLPNLFGEHGRPAYNSFVATFCRMLVDGEEPTVTGDRSLPLMHAQRAAEILLDESLGSQDVVLRPAGTERGIAEVLDHLRALHAVYGIGEVPVLDDQFAVDLFNTYRSFLPTDFHPFRATAHADPRGQLVEVARSHGGTSQSFVSTTNPGHVRGNHFHLSKFERFLVIEGEAEIGLRRLFDSTVVSHRVSGEAPAFVDMPTMWTHNIRNVGSGPLVTAFWADQLLDPQDPDQYALDVDGEVVP